MTMAEEPLAAIILPSDSILTRPGSHQSQSDGSHESLHHPADARSRQSDGLQGPQADRIPRRAAEKQYWKDTAQGAALTAGEARDAD